MSMTERTALGHAVLGALGMIVFGSTSAHAIASRCAASKIKIAGKTASCLLNLDAKQTGNSIPVNSTKAQKCRSKLSVTFAKADAKDGDCVFGAPGASAIQSKIDNFENDIDAALAVGTLPNKCQGTKTKISGKTASCLLSLQAKAVSSGGSPNGAFVQKCKDKLSRTFAKSETKGGCNTSNDAPPIESTIDAFVGDVKTELVTGVTTTSTTSSTTTSTTSTSTTSTTTTTLLLSFTTAPGTTSCGGAGLVPAAAAPTAGQLFSDTGATTPIAGGGLGLGCLYIGGGNATSVPPDQIPDASVELITVLAGGNLAGNPGTGPKDCTLGVKASKHCIGATNLGNACTTDSNCQVSVPDSCAADAQCFFGPPLPIPNGGLSTCVLNVIKTNVSGTTDASTGDADISLPLFSRVYLTGNGTSPCPKCVSGSCVGGQRNTLSCTTAGLVPTSLDCPPNPGNFLAQLNVDLTPLTTGEAMKTAADGNFCASLGQGTNSTSGAAGAFGKPTAEAIVVDGAPAGDITDGLPHNSNLASVFCIPMTGNLSIDIAADLPGPGAIGLNGNTQLQ
jgi:hypothetical protein